MSASKTTRRRLFERGGGRCAMCQRSLVIDAGPEGTEYHIAEAAHIVAEQPGGPRGEGDRPADIDGIDNLVLLCPSDHRAVDKGDGPRLWPRGKLLRLKRDHESWTAVLAVRPPPQPYGPRKAVPPAPGEVVMVDSEPYRLCGGTAPNTEDHTEDAYELVVHDGGSVVWCQGHAYGEGAVEGHAWLRRTEAPPGPGRLRAALADEAALLTDLPALPGLPRLLGVEMTARAVTVVTAMRSPATIRDRLARAPGHDELFLLARALPAFGEALGALHDRGLAHGALTPGTLLMPRPDALVLRDLGLAARGQGDPPADVHRLARVLYELVTGRRAGSRARHVAPSVLNPAVPPACDPVFRHALAADEAQRPGVRDFAVRLASALRTKAG